MTDAEIVAEMRRLAGEGRLNAHLDAMEPSERWKWLRAVDIIGVFSDREVGEACAALDANPSGGLPIGPEQAHLLTRHQWHRVHTVIHRVTIRATRRVESDYWSGRSSAIPPTGLWFWPDTLTGEIEEELRRDDDDPEPDDDSV